MCGFSLDIVRRMVFSVSFYFFAVFLGSFGAAYRLL